MNKRLIITVLRVLLFVFVLTLFVACSPTRTDVYVDDRPRHADVYVGEPLGSRGGPPPHAPAHGFRKKRTYYYYPDSRIYFDVGRRLYFYLSGDEWQVSASLPGDVHLRAGDYVRLQIDSDRPYLYSDIHKKKYPPRRGKKKK